MQNLTLLLEIVGLLIAMIEVKFPTTAVKIEDWIDNAGESFYAHGKKHQKSIWFQVVLSLALLFLFIQGLGWLFGNLNPPWWLWVIFWMFVSSTMYLIIIVLLGDFIVFLNKFANGQAITALGLVIAGIGAIIEMIQWVMKLFN